VYRLIVPPSPNFQKISLKTHFFKNVTFKRPFKSPSYREGKSCEKKTEEKAVVDCFLDAMNIRRR